MEDIILAVDAGSSSVRCSAYACAAGRVRPIDGASHRVPLAAVRPRTGHIRVDAVLSAIDACVDGVLAALRPTVRGADGGVPIRAVGFSTFVLNLVGVDASGAPVGDAATLSYACSRDDVAAECEALRSRLSETRQRRLYRQTGAPLHPSYALPQLLAFYRHADHRALARRVASWQSLSSLCLRRWTGGEAAPPGPISYSEASWTGLFDFRTCRWHEDAMDVLSRGGVAPGLLPRVCDFDEVRGRLRERSEYYDRWPEMRGARFYLGVGDGAAANIGSKCGAPDRIAVTIGTSAAARVCLPLSVGGDDRDVRLPPGLFCYRVDRRRVLVGGALTDGGSVVAWLRTLLRLEDEDRFAACMVEAARRYAARTRPTLPGAAAAAAAAAAAEEEVLLPFLAGERSTGFRGGATGCLSGLTRDTSPAGLVYAGVRAVTLRLGCVVSLLRDARAARGVEEEGGIVLVASGGALERNALWQQMIADCTGIKMAVEAGGELTSRGVAVLIANSTSTGDPVAEDLTMHEVRVPNRDSRGYWRDSLVKKEQLIESVASSW